MTTHFKSDAQPNETRSTTAACKGIARINGFRRAAQMRVSADPTKVTCVRCLKKVAAAYDTLQTTVCVAICEADEAVQS